MAVTSNDIADRLGISQPTISRILNGDPSYKVAPATRELIIATAAEMGYQPNALARSLRRKKTGVIGLYTRPNVVDMRQEFFAYLYGGLLKACETHHIDILVHKTFDGRRPEEVFAELADGRTDGAIVYLRSEDTLVARLREAELPVVAVADPLPGIPSVGCQDIEGITSVMDYLWSKGHRRFAFLATEHRGSAIVRRTLAFRQFLEARGLDPQDRIVMNVGDGQVEQVVDELLALPQPPSAICCWNDTTAYCVLRHCLARSLRVPENVAVVGFDGFVDAKLPHLDLVSVRVPWYDMVQTAVDLLMDRIAKRPVPLETLLPVEFIPGNTA
jgi:DNA-binding LacI/PurR family transcriptional regulator